VAAAPIFTSRLIITIFCIHYLGIPTKFRIVAMLQLSSLSSSFSHGSRADILRCAKILPQQHLLDFSKICCNASLSDNSETGAGVAPLHNSRVSSVVITDCRKLKGVVFVCPPTA
jgi:hypothetical protein